MKLPATIVLVGFVMAMTAPIEILYAIRLGLGTVMLTGFLLSSALGQILVDLLGTRVMTRVDVRGALVLGIMLFGVSEAGYALADGTAGLVLARVVQSVAGAVTVSAVFQLGVRGSATATRALGSLQSLHLLGGAVGAPLGGVLAGLLPGLAGYRLAFWVCTGAAVAAALAARMLLPRLPPTTPGRPRVGIPELRVPRRIRLALGLGLVGNFLRSGVENTAFPLVGSLRGLSTAEIGLALGVLSAVEIAVLAGSGRLFERWRVGRCLAVALVAGIGAAALLAWAPGPVAFLVAAAAFGLVDGVALAAPPVIMVQLTADAAMAVATYRIVCGVGSMAGSVLVNLMVTLAGPVGALAGVAGVLAVGGGLAARVGPPGARPGRLVTVKETHGEGAQ